MRKLLEIFGGLLEAIRGPRTISTVKGDVIHRTVTLTFDRAPLVYQVTSERLTYKTTYWRWWIPSTLHCLFVVDGQLLTGDPSHIDPRLLETVTYPNLSSFGLLLSEYPHVLAIKAYLDRIDATVDILMA